MKRRWLALCILLIPAVVVAEGDFKLTLSPIFLNVATNPGTPVTATVKVTNGSPTEEHLQVGLMKFRAFDDSGRPELLDMEPNDIYAQWVTFDPPDLTLAPGRSGQVAVKFNPPAEASLGYYYAVTFRRAGTPALTADQKTELLGTAAVLALLEVSSPNASRQISAVEFSTDRRWYDFLPVNFHLKLHNGGNVHLAPRGNIFIDRGARTDIAILDVNKAIGNILPDSDRSFSSTWGDGFPVREAGKLRWNLADAAKFRFGRYTAHLVMVYDDGQRDIPIETAISFWVLPWQIILAVFGVALLVLAGAWSFGRGLRRRLRGHSRT